MRHSVVTDLASFHICKLVGEQKETVQWANTRFWLPTSIWFHLDVPFKVYKLGTRNFSLLKNRLCQWENISIFQGCFWEHIPSLNKTTYTEMDFTTQARLSRKYVKRAFFNFRKFSWLNFPRIITNKWHRWQGNDWDSNLRPEDTDYRGQEIDRTQRLAVVFSRDSRQE